MAEAQKWPYQRIEVAVYALGGTVFIEVGSGPAADGAKTSFIKTYTSK